MAHQQEFLEAFRLHQSGALDDAETIYRRIIARQPRHADALHLLGVIEYQRGRHQPAAELIRRAIAIHPSAPDFHSNLALALLAADQTSAAADAYAASLRLKPDRPEMQYELARLYLKLRRLDLAVPILQGLLAQRPQWIAPWHDLGLAFADCGRMEDAIDCFARLTELQPNDAQTLYNLGTALMNRDRLDDAIAAFDRAISLDPNDAGAHNNLGNVLKDAGRLQDAIASYQRAIDINPADPVPHSNKIYCVNFDPRYDAPAVLQQHQDWITQCVRPLQKSLPPPPACHGEHKRLRIGYLSPDFRNHPVGSNLLPLLESHDHSSFEIFCYSAVNHPDQLTSVLRACADAWRDIQPLSDDAVAALVRQDEIDILVDLTQHMGANRIMIFARRPAPVQVTYLGYPGTTGLDAIDYRFSDPWLDPPEEDLCVYAERTIRLPVSYWCYRVAHEAPDIGPLPAVKNKFITFGCLNNFTKIPASFDLWAPLMAQIPQSRLILHAPRGSHVDRAREKFARAGVESTRLEFVEQQHFLAYLNTYNRIDIALDPYHYNGGITSCDALWMGVPLVTLAGKTPVGRMGCSILNNAGLPDLIARTPDQFIAVAASLAADLPRLTQLRQSLRHRMRQSPLRDARRFTRDVEAAYRQMWQSR